MHWGPSASLVTLHQRAHLLRACRNFFGEQGLLEVETPALVTHGMTDPHLQNLQVQRHLGPPLFLHTSPEFHMKRLLAAGAPDIWQLGKVFREGEVGRRHGPEFTLLEWYRHGYTLEQMAGETCALLSVLAQAAETEGAEARRPPWVPVYWTYATLFTDTLGIDPLTALPAELEDCARSALADRFGAELCRGLGAEATLWLDLLLSHVISTRLANTPLAVITGYPAAQAGLARLDPRDPRVAERFEVFCRGLEVANGYRELTDPTEQRQRFNGDRALRARLGRPDVVPDEHLLAALEQGFPDCAGVAVGFDRVVMVLLGLERLEDVISFAELHNPPV